MENQTPRSPDQPPESLEPWHPFRIAERLKVQADRLGVPQTTLLNAAKITEKAIRDLESEHWPNLKRIANLARAFRFAGGIAELLGLSLAEESNCDPRVLHVALEVVAGVIDSPSRQNPLKTEPHLFAALAAIAHQQLTELRRIDAQALSNAAVLHMISAMLRSEFAKFEREKS